MAPAAAGSPALDFVTNADHDVRVVATQEDFAALRPAWNALASQRPDLSVFATHEWHDAAWQWQRGTADLHVLVHAPGGRVRAILPLCRRGRDAGGPRRELAFVAVPDTQCCDVIAAHDDREAAHAFAAALAAQRGQWTAMRLAHVPPGGIASGALVDAFAALGFATRVAEAPGNPFVALDGRWDDYYASRGRRLKKANNLAANRLRRAGRVEVEWLTPGDGDEARAAALLAQAIEVSAASWKAATGTTLDQPGPGAFVRRLGTLARERGWLSLWSLRLDGVALATELQLVHGGQVHALRSDFRVGHEDISPGSHLNHAILEGLFGRGYARYWMGPGHNAYKFRWAEGTQALGHVTVYSRTVAGRARAAWELALKPWARRVRDRVRPGPAAADEEDAR